MKAKWLGTALTFDREGGRGGGPRGCSQMCNRDCPRRWRRGGMDELKGVGHRAAGERGGAARDVSRGAHNPEVAGSNPAPATNVAGKRPFPIWRGPLAYVARDQIRDQITDQLRLRRPAPSPAERRVEIRGTRCDGSGHLRRGRRVETQRSHLGPDRQASKVPPSSWWQYWRGRRHLLAFVVSGLGPWPQADPLPNKDAHPSQ